MAEFKGTHDIRYWQGLGGQVLNSLLMELSTGAATMEISMGFLKGLNIALYDLAVPLLVYT